MAIIKKLLLELHLYNYNLVKRWMQSLKYSYFLQWIVWWISTSMYKVLFCVFLIDFSFLYDCTTVGNQWCLLWRDSQTDRIELCKFCLFPKLHSDRENVYIDSIIGYLYTLLVLIWTWQTNFCKRHKKRQKLLAFDVIMDIRYSSRH